MSLQDKASIIWPKGAPYKAGNLAAWNPQTQALVNFPVTRATTKTRVNEAGLIESVAANVLPRDFSNGGCGDFAIEPQRTNIVSNSRNLASGWSLLNTTASSITSGIFSTGNDTEVIENATTTSIYGVDLSPRFTTLVTTNTYVLSVTVKKGARDWIYIKDFNGFQSPVLEVWFNINTGTVGTVNGPSASGSIVALSNGYYRCSLKFTANSVSCDFRIAGATANNTLSYTGVVGNVAFVFAHAQAELGDYASSHILTTGSIVTRNDDEVSLSNASALLGQQSGSIYVEFEASESVEFIKINSKIFIYITPAGQVRGTIFQDGTKTVNGSTVGFNQKTKVCLRYQSGNTTIFTNGVKGGTTATPYLFDAELNNITIGSSGFFTAAKEAFKYSEAVVFKEVITDEQAIELTTP